MNTVSLLQEGDQVCELVPSALYPLPKASALVPGRELIIVTATHVEPASEGYSIGMPDGSTVPIEIVSRRVGIEGWDMAVRVKRDPCLIH
jgi:hypothetical protein